MIALENQFTALRLANKSQSVSNRGRSGPLMVAEYDASQILPSSQPYAWAEDTVQAVWLASATVPDTATFHAGLFPGEHPGCWWWFARPLPIAMQDKAVDGETVDTEGIAALLMCRSESGLFIADFRTTPLGPMLTGFSIIPTNASLSEVTTGRNVGWSDGTGEGEATTPQLMAKLRFVLAASAWLQQRIAIIGSGHVERHRRKQLAREHDATVDDVKVVQLRRIESQPRESTDTESIDWSCRWIVNGHWRHQPHKDGRKLIYINPFMKGPSDKPLKVPTHTVYHANR